MSKSRKYGKQLFLFFPNHHQNLPSGGERRTYSRANLASIAFFRFYHSHRSTRNSPEPQAFEPDCDSQPTAKIQNEPISIREPLK